MPSYMGRESQFWIGPGLVLCSPSVYRMVRVSAAASARELTPSLVNKLWWRYFDSTGPIPASSRSGPR